MYTFTYQKTLLHTLFCFFFVKSSKPFSVYLNRFYDSVSFCCEIFCTKSYALKSNLLPYCSTPFRYQEVKISSETVTKKVQS